jgi:hypothetical protein
METYCTACGSQLAEGVRFCGNCGTVNEPGEAPAPLIDQAPFTSEVSGGIGRAAVITSGRKLDGKVAPIVFGQRTTLEGADDAVKPAPVPWKERRSDRRSSAVARPGAGTPSIVLMMVAALLVVSGVGCNWVATKLGDGAAASSMLAPVQHRSRVARALGSAIADQLVTGNFVTPARRDEAARKATSFIVSPAFDRGWSTAVGKVQAGAMERDNALGDGSLGLDLTSVVDHLRLDGVAASNASIPPIALARPASADQVRSALGASALVALVFFGLALLFGIIGLVRSKNRARSMRWFGVVLTGWAVVSIGLSFVVPGVLVGDPVDRAAKPALDAAKGVVSSNLASMFALVATVGVVLGVAAFLVERAARRREAIVGESTAPT